MPVHVAQAIARLITNSTSCVATATQIAGVKALTSSQDSVDQMVEAFRQRRDVIVKGLNQIPGFKCLMPAGAFYAFPSIEGTGRKSKELADYLLNEAGVATLSGTAFGSYGEGFLRLSYANSIENIQKALEQIDTAVRKM
jgi:aspartate aminotransferase